MADAALLLLGDGRLPTGGHAHSGGLEAAVASGSVTDASHLASWLEGRLSTAGMVDAATAAAAWHLAGEPSTAPAPTPSTFTAPWGALVGEWAARTPSPAQRAASRAQGRGLVRAAARAWPSALPAPLSAGSPAPGLGTHGAPRSQAPPWPVVLGAVARAVGVDVHDTATVAATAAVSGPAWAATRLLSLDPFDVMAVLADLAPAVDAVATLCADENLYAGEMALLPSPSAPLLDLAAEDHATWEVRLFAS